MKLNETFDKPLLKTTYGMRLLSIPASSTPDLYGKSSSHAMVKMQLNKRKIHLENIMSTAKRSKEAHEFKVRV